MLKSTPVLILIKMVFDVGKCLAITSGSEQMYALLPSIAVFFKCKLFLQLAVLNYDDW